MSSNRGDRSETRSIVRGAAVIVLQALVIGFAANTVNPNRLPWVRVPLADTRRTAGSLEVLGLPAPKPPDRKVTPSPGLPAVNAARPEAAPEPGRPAAEESPVAKPAPAAQPAPPEAKPAPHRAVSPQEPAAPPVKPPAPVKDSPGGGRPAQAKPVEALFTTLDDAKALFDGGQALFLDARHQADYAAEHITGALSLYVDDVEARYRGVLGAIPKDRTIVTYCSDAQCESAVELADALVARGHTRVFILLDGLPGWVGAGYPTRAGVNP